MPELLERDGEIGCLRRLVDAAVSGAGGLLLVEGDAGIGKTGLVRAAGDLAAQRGVRVLGARGAELESDLAFGVVRELLGRCFGTLDGAAELAEPVLGSAAVPVHDLFAALHGLYWLTADMGAARPTLLVVDDAQWCDVPSLRFLAYLAHRLDGLPVALLVTTRPDAPAAQQDLLGILAAEPLAAQVRPRPLTTSAVDVLVGAALGPADREFSAACRTATGGNPFLLGELLAELGAADVAPRAAGLERLAGVVPRGVQRSVRTRLAGLPGAAADLARAAAVLGDGADLRRAARLAGIPPEGAGPAADALVAARLVERDVVLTFLHPLLRSAVAATSGPAELATVHRRAAALLAEEGETGDALVPHLLAATPVGDPWVVDELRGAARRATGRGAPEAAARYLLRALAEPAHAPLRYPLLLQLGLAETQVGAAEAVGHLTAAVEQAPGAPARAQASLLLARAMFHVNRFSEAVRVCERAIAELGDRHADLALELEVQLMTIGNLDVALRPVVSRWLARRSGGDPEPASRAGCMLLAGMAGEEVLGSGSRERTIALAEKALVGGHLLGEQAVVSLPNALLSLVVAGRARRAVRVWDEVIVRKRADGDVRAFGLASAFRGYAAYYTGDLDAAVADTRSALDLSRGPATLPVTEALAVAWLTYALIDAGDLDTAEEELGVSGRLFAVGAPFTVNYLLSARGQLRLAQGRFDEAVADLEECGRRSGAWSAAGPVLCRWRSHLALALLGRGDRERATAAARDALARARAWGAPQLLAEALRAAGLTAGGGSGEALLREAVEVAVDVPLERARALVALGGALRSGGSRIDARPPLREALDLAVGRGATAIARAAHDELVVTGARPRRLRVTGADALTATERRVAGMAMGGLTNRGVAQALFVSEKTVETHLGHAYRKLGITARSQLGDALASTGALRTARG